MQPKPHPQLTTAQIQDLTDLLRSERARLMRSIERADRDGPVQLDQQAVGRLSRMDALMNEGLAQGSMSRAREEVGLIDQALERLEDGTYGFCQACGEPMNVNRLMAIPEALQCAGCRV